MAEPAKFPDYETSAIIEQSSDEHLSQRNGTTGDAWHHSNSPKQTSRLASETLSHEAAISAALHYLLSCSETQEYATLWQTGVRKSSIERMTRLGVEGLTLVAKESTTGTLAVQLRPRQELVLMPAWTCIRKQTNALAQSHTATLNRLLQTLLQAGVATDTSNTLCSTCASKSGPCDFEWTAREPVVDVLVDDRVLQAHIHDAELTMAARDLLRIGATRNACQAILGISRRRLKAIRGNSVAAHDAVPGRGRKRDLSSEEVCSLDIAHADEVAQNGHQSVATVVIALSRRTGIDPRRVWKYLLATDSDEAKSDSRFRRVI